MIMTVGSLSLAEVKFRTYDFVLDVYPLALMLSLAILGSRVQVVLTVVSDHQRPLFSVCC